MNKIIYLSELDPFLKWWPFLLEGLKVLNSPQGGNGNITESRYFKTLLRIVMGLREEGTIMVLVSKNDKPLAYVVLVDNTPVFEAKSVLCFAIYSNEKCATAIKQLHGEMQSWSKAHGYVKMYASSRRISGAAVRLFEQKWGFKRDSLVFCRDI